MKDHWYHCRLLGAGWPTEGIAGAEALHDLSDVLGDHQDLTLLGEVLEQGRLEIPDPDFARLRAAVERRRAELRDEAARLGASIFAPSPAALVASARRAWESAGAASA